MVITGSVLLLALVGVLSITIYFLLRRIIQLQKQLQKRDQISLQHQRSSLKGNMSQQWAPILPDFPVKNASDVFHFGGVIDFIAFEGISHDAITKIWFIDSKYNQSSLSTSQKQIRKIVDELHALKPNLIEFRKYNPKEGAERAFKEKGIERELE